jgi:hypothetical protein
MTSLYLHSSHLFLYSLPGACRRLEGDPAREFEQLGHTQSTAARGHCHEGIHSDRIRPRRGQRVQPALRVGEPDAVVPPVLAVGDQIELVLVERMVRMGDAEASRRNITMRRS